MTAEARNNGDGDTLLSLDLSPRLKRLRTAIVELFKDLGGDGNLALCVKLRHVAAEIITVKWKSMRH